MVILSHPTGNTFARAVLEGLTRTDLLEFFATTVAVQQGNDWSKFLPSFLRQELNRRQFRVSSNRLLARPALEILRLASNRLGLDALSKHEKGIASTDAVYKDLDAAVAEIIRWEPWRRIKAVYAYEDGALESFKAAREAGIRTIYDLPIAYWETTRNLMDEEAVRLPQWEPTLMSTRDSSEKMDRKTQEMNLADLVVCPSQFVLDSIPARTRSTKRCCVVEFGTPDIRPAQRRSNHSNSPLRVLFAGTMTQRKGLADLFAAINILERSDVELVVMGSMVASHDFYKSQCKTFRYEPTRPHAKVLELMSTCDILALPSIIEGRALVQQEAMACGLPLLVTRNAGAEDLVDEGKTGWLVPIRSPEAIAEKISWAADHRMEIESMREYAQRRAMALTWSRYQAMILNEIVSMMNKS